MPLGRCSGEPLPRHRTATVTRPLASLASLVQDDVHVGRVLREMEMKDRLNRLRLLAGD